LLLEFLWELVGTFSTGLSHESVLIHPLVRFHSITDAKAPRSSKRKPFFLLVQGRRSKATIAPGRQLLAPRGGRPLVGGAARWRWRASLSLARWEAIVMERRRGGCCWQDGRGGQSLMGEVVLRCGTVSLVKIVIRESQKSQGVMFVQVSTSSPCVIVVSKCLFL
jgi:hypothetical protein